MVSENKLKLKLGLGEIAIGCQVRSRSPLIAELFGYCGFDYIFIENEHFGFNVETVEQVIRACALSGTESILRIPDHDPAKILQFLDMGVKGLLLPHVDSEQEAIDIVKAGKFKPRGERGFSNTSCATLYGGIPMADYKKLANENTMLIAFIESRQAVERIDGILASGIDAVHLGPGDLSESFDGSAEETRQAMDRVIAAAKKAEIPVACVAATLEDAADLVERGISMISFSSDLMLLKACCDQTISAFYQRINHPA